MHPCLFIQEILLNTFQFLYDCYDFNPELASLARCCKAFHVPAITVLWYYQDSLTPVLKHCLPHDVWYLSSNDSLPSLRLVRDLRPDDYARIKYYSRYIRVLGMKHQGHDIYLPPSVSSILWSRNPEKRRLVPNLHHLTAPLDYFEGSAAYARLTIGPCLQTLRIESLVETENTTISHRVFSWDNVVALLEPARLSLTSLMLDFDLVANQTPFDDALTLAVLSSFPNLKVLHIKSIPFSYHNLRRLLQTRLQDMSITLTTQPESQTILHQARIGDQTCFSNLRRLAVSTLDLNFVGLLLLDFSFKLLEEITIETHQSVFLDLYGLFTAFACSCASWKLKSIEVSKVPTDMLELTLPAIIPLFHFTNLTKLKIDGYITPTMDDTMLTQMVEAWPHLQILHLYDVTSREAPKIKLSSLLIIATTCTVLEALAIRFDARTCPLYCETGEIRPCTSLRNLQVLTSPADSTVDGEDIASFLTLAFPGLANIFDHFLGLSPDNVEHNKYASVWRQVNVILGSICDSHWNSY